MDITEIAKQTKEDKSNGVYIKNKDLLWYLVSLADKHDKRILKIEVKQKVSFMLIPLIVTIAGIIIILV